MKPSIDNVRDLAAKNAGLLHHASLAHEKVLDAAESECERLAKLIDGVTPADVLGDGTKADMYQAWVTQRAGLMRLLAERHA